ncbi:hypothetical protein [Mucilaginibacter sp. UR6-1]|nr:hypothetical protein [Mucilaginibacter sp. UR6-1]
MNLSLAASPGQADAASEGFSDMLNDLDGILNKQLSKLRNRN